MNNTNNINNIKISRATKKAIINALDNSEEPIDTGRITEKTGLNHRTVCRALTVLESEGMLKVYKTRGWLILPAQK
ncbi:hypothetical protein BEH94_10525 [Candidatus Altiarchaeales archaeon WOR_SM1_SCG]|nr:hypothetical protein BEH94_10525 [Candidatus Altiarchaeales archaeon WOR_SM1_SCG]